jgi:hypothetical protein
MSRQHRQQQRTLKLIRDRLVVTIPGDFPTALASAE